MLLFTVMALLLQVSVTKCSIFCINTIHMGVLFQALFTVIVLSLKERVIKR